MNKTEKTLLAKLHECHTDNEILGIVNEYAQQVAYNCVSDYAQYLTDIVLDPSKDSKCVGMWFEKWLKQKEGE